MVSGFGEFQSVSQCCHCRARLTVTEASEFKKNIFEINTDPSCRKADVSFASCPLFRLLLAFCVPRLPTPLLMLLPLLPLLLLTLALVV